MRGPFSLAAPSFGIVARLRAVPAKVRTRIEGRTP
jgi:hypothetical protein